MKTRSRLLVWFVSAVALSLCGVSTSEALTFVRVSDEDLAAQADLIVEVEITAATPADGRTPGIDFEARVLDVIQGDPDGDVLTVRTLGGPSQDGRWLKVHGVPRFQPRERVLLFLKEGRDGVLRILHTNQGVFFISRLEGRDIAWRSFTGAHEMPLVGRTLQPEVPRDLQTFVDWLRAPKASKTASYRLESADLSALAETRNNLPLKFTLISADGLPARWRQFDTGGSVTFRAHVSGQPGLPGGGFSEFQTALQAWTNDAATPIQYVYGGTTTASGGLSDGMSDNVNAILFGDPNNDSFDSPFDCSSGGTLAVGGPWYNFTVHTFQGTTYRTSLEADIVTNKNIGCYVPFNNRAPELFAHELGHTLGLGHSCGEDSPADCNTTAKNQALMRAFIHGDGRGAQLGSDDRAGIGFLYAGSTGTAPTAPADLQAIALSGAVEVSWTDVASNESTYRVERALGPGGFTEIATLSAGSTFYRDALVATGTTYRYRVRAVNAIGASAYAGPVSVTTLGPSAPSGLTATALSSASVRLDWVDNAAGESGYEVQARLVGGTFTSIGTASANSEQATVIELAPATTYEFRVRATSPLGASSFSNTAFATTFSSEPGVCVSGPTTACVNSGRFRIEIDWLDFADNIGAGTVVEVPPSVAADDSAVFWFFGDDNWELLVKVLDGCGVNDRFWVFAAATTNVEYTMRVTDTASGFVRVYTNPLGVASPAIADVDAFASCSASSAAPSSAVASSSVVEIDRGAPGRLAEPVLLDTNATVRADADLSGEALTTETLATKDHGCTPDTFGACLQDGRFRVEIDWRDFEGLTGPGRRVSFGSNDSGLFWFFGPDNWEVLVKVLDGCGVNNRFWVFAAATTNVEYTLTVTDTERDAAVIYSNPLGQLADAITDTDAFATCP